MRERAAGVRNRGEVRDGAGRTHRAGGSGAKTKRRFDKVDREEGARVDERGGFPRVVSAALCGGGGGYSRGCVPAELRGTAERRSSDGSRGRAEGGAANAAGRVRSAGSSDSRAVAVYKRRLMMMMGVGMKMVIMKG